MRGDECNEIRTLLNDMLDKIVKPERLNLLIRIDEQPILPNHYVCVFNASEVAVILNENPYVSKSRGLYEYLIKIYQFKKIMDGFNFISNLNKEEKIVKNVIKKFEPELKTIADAASGNLFYAIDELNSFISSNINIMVANLIVSENIKSEKLASIIKSQFHSEVNKRRGNNLEHKSLDEIELNKNIRITRRNTEKFEKRSKNHLYKLVGKIDGFNENENCVIEVKNRLNKKEALPFYDYIQCIVYMRLTNTKKCNLYECYSDGFKNENLIEWNQTCFDNIDTKLTEFVNFVRRITKNDLHSLVRKYHEEYV